MIIEMRFGIKYRGDGRGDDAERSSRPHGDLPVLYLETGEKDHETSQKRNCAIVNKNNGIKLYMKLDKMCVK